MGNSTPWSSIWQKIAPIHWSEASVYLSLQWELSREVQSQQSLECTAYSSQQFQEMIEIAAMSLRASMSIKAATLNGNGCMPSWLTWLPSNSIVVIPKCHLDDWCWRPASFNHCNKAWRLAWCSIANETGKDLCHCTLENARSICKSKGKHYKFRGLSGI